MILSESDPRPNQQPAYAETHCSRCHKALTLVKPPRGKPIQHDRWTCEPCNKRTGMRAVILDMPLIAEHKRAAVRKMLTPSRHDESWRKRAEHFTRVRDEERAAASLAEAIGPETDTLASENTLIL